jgi:serine/threonine protein kinase
MSSAGAKRKKIFDGRYEILSIVGRGKCSVVYHARHVTGNQADVALKVLLSRKGSQSNAELLRKEALAMVSARHRYVVRLDDFHSVGELAYLSMEFAPKSDLRKYTATLRDKKLGPIQGQLFLVQSAEALNHLHQAGMIHRDMKPDNILVINEREVRLADFGVAVLPGENSSLDELQRGVGTMSYMAPEVLDGSRYDQSSDLYALGVSFYEMLSGTHPFDGVPLMQQLKAREDGAFPELKKIAPEVPQYLSDVLMSTLRYRPEDRVASAKDLIQNLLESKKQAAASTVAAKKSSKAAKPSPSDKKPYRHRTARPTAKTQMQVRPPVAAAPEKKATDTPVAAQSTQPSPKPRTRKPSPAQAAIQRALSEAAQKGATTPDSTTQAESIPNTQPTQKPDNKPPISDEVLGGFAPRVTKKTTHTEPKKEDPSPEKQQAALNNEPDVAKTVSLQREQVDELRKEANYEPQPTPQPKTTTSHKEPVHSPVSPSALPPTKATSSISSFLRIATLIALAIAVYVSYPEFMDMLAGKSKTPSTPLSSQEIATASLPTFDGGALTFPALPAGVYSGTMSGIAAGQDVPLTLIALPDTQHLVVIVGLAGWSPSVITLPGDDAHVLRVKSNGYILDLTAQDVEGSLHGYFKNIISGHEGEWQAQPQV